MVKNLPTKAEDMRTTFLCRSQGWDRSQDWEEPLEEGMATYSSILAWRIPRDRGVGYIP